MQNRVGLKTGDRLGGGRAVEVGGLHLDIRRERLPARMAAVVDNQHRGTVGGQPPDGVHADEARAPGHQDALGHGPHPALPLKGRER